MESVKEVVEAKVEEVLESKKEEIHEKVEDVAEKVDAVADKVCEKVEDELEKVIDKLEEIVPGGAKLVEVIDEALVGVGCSCGLFGWDISVRKSHRSQTKPLKSEPSS